MPDALKFLLILRIRLDPQTSRQDELTDRGRETGQEGVEWLYVYILCISTNPLSRNPSLQFLLLQHHA